MMTRLAAHTGGGGRREREREGAPGQGPAVRISNAGSNFPLLQRRPPQPPSARTHPIQQATRPTNGLAAQRPASHMHGPSSVPSHQNHALALASFPSAPHTSHAPFFTVLVRTRPAFSCIQLWSEGTTHASGPNQPNRAPPLSARQLSAHTTPIPGTPSLSLTRTHGCTSVELYTGHPRRKRLAQAQ